MATAAQPQASQNDALGSRGAGHVDLEKAAAARPVKTQVAHRLSAFGFPRFYAAVHIAYYHWNWGGDQGGEHVWLSNIRSWGSTWVPFFFLLSGFVATYSQLNKSKPMEVGSFTSTMRRRWLTVYPLYASSLLVIVFRSCGRMNLGTWLSLPFHALLLQAWIPTTYHKGDSFGIYGFGFFNGVAWYLSDLVFMWMIWWLIYRFVATSSVVRSIVCLAFAVSVSAFWPVVFYFKWHGVHWDTPLATMAWSLPLSNLHIFVCGMFLAKLFIERRQMASGRADSVLRGIERISVSLSSVCLLATFAAFPLNGLTEIAAREGLLLPLQLLLAWGLAAERDPLAILFTQAPFTYCDQLSYGVYILQAITDPLYYSFINAFHMTGAPLALRFMTHLTILIAYTVFMNRLFEKPIQAYFK